jgi:DNA-binding NarL/FixJ family response regulator
MSDAFILLVTGDASTERALSSALPPACSVVSQPSLTRARRAVSSDCCAGIVTEAEVRDGSGLAWLSSLREREMIRAPALVLTTKCERALVNNAQRLGARLLCRPFDPADLQSFVEDALALDGRRRDDPTMSVIATAIAHLTRVQRLTHSESAILVGALNGLSRADFIELRGISVNTYKWAARSLLRKLRAGSVGEIRDRVLRDLALAGRIA